MFLLQNFLQICKLVFAKVDFYLKFFAILCNQLCKNFCKSLQMGRNWFLQNLQKSLCLQQFLQLILQKFAFLQKLFLQFAIKNCKLQKAILYLTILQICNFAKIGFATISLRDILCKRGSGTKGCEDFNAIVWAQWQLQTN